MKTSILTENIISSKDQSFINLVSYSLNFSSDSTTKERMIHVITH